MLSIYNKIKHFWLDPSMFKYRLIYFTTFQAVMGFGYYIKSIAGFAINYKTIFLSYSMLNAGLLLMITNHKEPEPVDVVRIVVRVDDVPN